MDVNWLYQLKLSRPEMLHSGPDQAESGVLGEHLGYLQRAADAGVVLLAGRTQLDTPESFGLVLFSAESEELALQFMRHDPAVSSGLMQAELFPYRIAVAGKPLSRKQEKPNEEQ